MNSFSDPGLDYTEAEEAIRTFLVQGGFPLFDPEEEGASDIFVIPEGGFAPMRTRRYKREMGPGENDHKARPPGGVFF